jgi:hypothetical protein
MQQNPVKKKILQGKSEGKLSGTALGKDGYFF